MDFKVKCAEYFDNDGTQQFTVGRVYDVHDGAIISDRGYNYTAWTIGGNETFEDLYVWFRKWYVFELVEEVPVPNDPVNHPAHYTKGKIEVADFIADQKLNFDRGNAVKYVCRAGSKDPDKEIQDLEKAIWYINHEIKTLKGEANDAAEKEN